MAARANRGLIRMRRAPRIQLRATGSRTGSRSDVERAANLGQDGAPISISDVHCMDSLEGETLDVGQN